MRGDKKKGACYAPVVASLSKTSSNTSPSFAQRLAALELASRLATLAATCPDPVARYAAAYFAADGARALRRALCVRGDSMDDAAAGVSPAAVAALVAADAAAAHAATSGRWSSAAWSGGGLTGSGCAPLDDEDDTATSAGGGGGAAHNPPWSKSPTRRRSGGGGRALWRSLQASLKINPSCSGGGGGGDGSPDTATTATGKALRSRPSAWPAAASRRRLIRTASTAGGGAGDDDLASSPTPLPPPPALPGACAARAAAVLAAAAPARSEPVAWLWLLVEAHAAAVGAGAVPVAGPPPPGAAAATAARLLASASLSSWPGGGGGGIAAAALAHSTTTATAAQVDATAPLQYLARVCRRLAPEEGWLRLTAAALAPALAVLREGGGGESGTSLPPPVERALAAVAPRAMGAAEDAVRRYRTLRSGRRDNAATLGAGARLLALVTSGGGGEVEGGRTGPAATTGFGEVLAGLLAEGAAARYASLARSTTGSANPAAQAASDGGPPPLSTAQLADLMEGLATDLADDEEVYGPSLAAWPGLDLPAVSARAFLGCLRKDVTASLAAAPSASASAPRAAVAAAALHARASRHAPGAADAALRPGGHPAFAQAVDAWLGGVAAKLCAASGRLLAAEGWDGGGGIGGAGGSRSLVDFFIACCAVAEGEAALARADVAHAASLERALAGAVRTHAAALAGIAQGGGGSGLPRVSGPAAAVARVRAAAAAARRGSGTGPAPADDPLTTPPRPALGAAADLRALGARTADLAAALRSAIPRAWWGTLVGAAEEGGTPACLGDSFRGVRLDADAALARLCAGVGGAAAVGLRKEVSAALDAETAAAAAAGPGGRSGRSSTTTTATTAADAAAAAAQRALRSRVRGWAAATASALGGSGDGQRVGRRVGLAAWATLADGLRSRALGGAGPAPAGGPLASGGAAVVPALMIPPTLAPRAAAALRVLASLEAAFLVDGAFGLDGGDVPAAASRARRDFGDALAVAGWKR